MMNGTVMGGSMGSVIFRAYWARGTVYRRNNKHLLVAFIAITFVWVKPSSFPNQTWHDQPFRNEVMDTVRLNVNMEWFVRLPRRGTIRMDVVSSIRPRLSVRPMSEARFGALKTLLDVDGEMAQVRYRPPLQQLVSA